MSNRLEGNEILEEPSAVLQFQETMNHQGQQRVWPLYGRLSWWRGRWWQELHWRRGSWWERTMYQRGWKSLNRVQSKSCWRRGEAYDPHFCCCCAFNWMMISFKAEDDKMVLYEGTHLMQQEIMWKKEHDDIEEQEQLVATIYMLWYSSKWKNSWPKTNSWKWAIASLR